MGTVVDLRKAISKLSDEKEFHSNKLKDLEIKIQVANELLSIPDIHISVGDQLLLKPTLPTAIISILSQRNEWLMATDVYVDLKNQEFKTNSNNFKLLVATTINKMAKRNRVQSRRKDGKVQYAVLGFSDNGDRVNVN